VRGLVTEIAANPVYLDVGLAANSNFVYPVPRDHMLLACVFEEAGRFGAEAEPVPAVHDQV
jgi:hypothetical protein